MCWMCLLFQYEAMDCSQQMQMAKLMELWVVAPALTVDYTSEAGELYMLHSNQMSLIKGVL